MNQKTKVYVFYVRHRTAIRIFFMLAELSALGMAVFIMITMYDYRHGWDDAMFNAKQHLDTLCRPVISPLGR